MLVLQPGMELLSLEWKQILNHWTTKGVQAFLWLRCVGAALVVVHWSLMAVASLVREHRLSGVWFQELWHAGSAVAAPRLWGTGSAVGVHRLRWGSPGGSDGKESACNAGGLGLTPESGRSPGGGQGSPL